MTDVQDEQGQDHRRVAVAAQYERGRGDGAQGRPPSESSPDYMQGYRDGRNALLRERAERDLMGWDH